VTTGTDVMATAWSSAATRLLTSGILSVRTSDGLVTSETVPTRSQVAQSTVGFNITTSNTQPVADLFATADDALFKRMLANQHHVLQPLLPDQSSHNYNHSLRGSAALF